jgi:hypothetical protein
MYDRQSDSRPGPYPALSSCVVTSIRPPQTIYRRPQHAQIGVGVRIGAGCPHSTHQPPSFAGAAFGNPEDCLALAVARAVGVHTHVLLCRSRHER